MTRSPAARQSQRRDVAFRLLKAAVEDGRWMNRLAPALLDPLSPRDRRFVSHLVYTTLRRLPLLDWKLKQLVHTPWESLNPEPRTILRLGACELEEGHPPPPVVSAWVEIAKRYHRPSAGLINAVLRRFPSHPFPSPPPWVEIGLPPWLYHRWHNRPGWPEKTWRTWLHTPPNLYIRVNTAIGPLLEVKEQIRQWYQTRGGEVEETILPEGLRVYPHPWEINLPPSWYYLQDLSSMLVVHLLDPKPGEWIWDVAAAPGGKTSHIVARTHGEAHVVASDVIPSRIRQTQKVLRRLHTHSSVYLLIADGRQVAFRRLFDRVLLDAPCSGLGPLRRKPEVLLRMNPTRILELASLQQDLLNHVSRYIRPGGILVYATCTTEPEENTEQIQTFLEHHPHFVPFPLSQPHPGFVEITERMYRIGGAEFNTDYAFAARLKRIR